MQHRTRTGDKRDNSSKHCPTTKGTYFGAFFFTLVQGQTPVTPPTLANTKENWMEEGTDHVICMDKDFFKYVS